SVNARASVQKNTPECALYIEIQQVDLSQPGRPRQKKIQAHEPAAWLQDAPHFLQRNREPREIPKTISHEDYIETGVLKGQGSRVGADAVANLCQAQHRLGEIGGDHARLRTPCSDQPGEVACST